tara:strand:- start:466 stop:825 length:360 start_codon:yes stop_codon:yes gene_type:complete
MQGTSSNFKKLPASFYATSSGNEPVREWLLDLDDEDRRTVGHDIATAEYGWPVGMPLCKSLGKGMWEIRSNISHGRIARVIFAMVEERMVLLHSFVKKTQKTSKPDFDLAEKRKKEIAP